MCKQKKACSLSSGLKKLPPVLNHRICYVDGFRELNNDILNQFGAKFSRRTSDGRLSRMAVVKEMYTSHLENSN